jgi:transcription elongation factor Elf1
MQQQELEEARKQTEQQRQQLRLQRKQYDEMMKCPRCGSTSLSGNKKGYGVGKGVVGAAIFGPLGLVAGNIGSGKVMVTCMKCGYKFRA